MPRILVTYQSAAERRVAAHEAVRLARDGFQVDLLAGTSSRISGGRYDAIIAGSSPELARLASPDDGGGTPGWVRIIGSEARERSRRRAVRIGALVGILAALPLIIVGAPWIYPPLIGAVVGAAAGHAFGAVGLQSARASSASRPSGLRAAG